MMEPIICDDCGKLCCYGEGDLNCCEFVCPECFAKGPREPKRWGLSPEERASLEEARKHAVTIQEGVIYLPPIYDVEV